MEDNQTHEAEDLTWLPQAVVLEEQTEKPASKLKAGDLCPKCKLASMDYDGLLNLTCPNCGYALGGCFT